MGGSFPLIFTVEMSCRGLSGYLMIPRDFDAQLEAYLLSDWQRRERAETTLSLGNIHYHEAKVMIEGKWVEKEWLTVTGMAVDALTDGQEIILASFKGTDGSFWDAAILRVQKWNGETCLIYRVPWVILEKLGGKV